jgi:hypothetical protein
MGAHSFEPTSRAKRLSPANPSGQPPQRAGSKSGGEAGDDDQHHGQADEYDEDLHPGRLAAEAVDDRREAR